MKYRACCDSSGVGGTVERRRHERPLYPTAVEPADHTHAFDVYCRPFQTGTDNLAAHVLNKIHEDTQAHEVYAAVFLTGLFIVGLALRVFDRRCRLEAWLERPVPATEQPRAWRNVALPTPVLGLAALAILVAVSLVGCYTYYPPANESLDQLTTANTETLSAALVGNRKQAEHWIPIYADWVRKLQVGVYLRTGRLSEFHRMKARLLEDRLELLEHELADNDREAVHDLIGLIARTERRLRIAFLSQSEAAPQSANRAKAAPMPEGAKADVERTLYLTAKGKYTDADIAANGRMTASEKYKEFHSAHDFSPKLGEPICPVTHTKANAECSWIIGGKRYLFCCPPCIDEFVRMAKESPDKIQEPAAYVSR